MAISAGLRLTWDTMGKWIKPFLQYYKLDWNQIEYDGLFDGPIKKVAIFYGSSIQDVHYHMTTIKYEPIGKWF
jgi:hypothetical protein